MNRAIGPVPRAHLSILIGVLAASSVLFSGCVTTPTSSAAHAQPGTAVTYATDPKAVSLVIRDLGNLVPVNLALMLGVDTRSVGPYDFRNAPADVVLGAVADDAGIEQFHNETYEFFAPSDYAQLNELDLSSMLPARVVFPNGSVSIGADTPLFDALALLSQAFDTTIVADNAVAAARSGELAMSDINGMDALEALLKSARLNAANFRVTAGDNYVLFHAAGNPPRTDVIANREALSKDEQSLLNRHVSVRLPQSENTPADIAAYAGATTLGNVLPTLSAQLGCTVTAEKELLRFPINPCLMINVSVRNALQILINQWLVQDFVVDVEGDSLHIRADKEPETPGRT